MLLFGPVVEEGVKKASYVVTAGEENVAGVKIPSFEPCNSSPDGECYPGLTGACAELCVSRAGNWNGCRWCQD